MPSWGCASGRAREPGYITATAERLDRNVRAFPRIILVTSGHRLYREYLLRMLAASARVWLFTDASPTWEQPYIVGHTIVDTLDVPAMVEAGRALRAEESLHGVVCWNEVKVIHTARLAQALGLPGGDGEAVGRCRDKHRTRVALAERGIGQPLSAVVATPEQARAAADRIGYPVVLKPRSLGASYGVMLVRTPAELDTGFARAREAREYGVPFFRDGVLVEEYLDGPEISVDSACQDGLLTPLFVARKVSDFHPYFEETGHSVDSHDPLLRDPRLAETLVAAHRAVGFRDGITHTEVKLTAQGPKIIEINARLGGDMIPYVGYLATGIDAGRIAVDVACGDAPRVEASHRRVAAVRFLYPKRDAIAAAVEIDYARLPASVVTVRPLASAGQELLLPPRDNVACRYAYAIAVGDTIDECESDLEAATRATGLRVERYLAQDRAAA